MDSPLRFHKDGHFRILMISDLHSGSIIDPRVPLSVEYLVDKTLPDLVLMGGDICGPNHNATSVAQVRAVVDAVTRPMRVRGIPWAHVYGNHDDEGGVPKEVQQRIYEEFEGCLSEAGPSDIDGVGNYYLPILDAESGEPAYMVWGMDSHSEFPKENPLHLPEWNNQLLLYRVNGCHTPYDGPRFNQIRWYYEASEEIEHRYGRVPGLLYMHIPCCEFSGVSANPGACNAVGHQFEEGVGCPAVNNGLFWAVRERGDIEAILAGHDHNNDFIGQYCGVLLGYDAGLGYQAYYRRDMVGGRVLDLARHVPKGNDPTGANGDPALRRRTLEDAVGNEPAGIYRTYMEYVPEEIVLLGMDPS